MINKDRLINRFLKYVQTDSETKNEKAMADILVEELKTLGLDVFRDKAGESIGSNTNNIVARLKGRAEKPSIFFSAHMDTVKPGNGVNPIVEDGVIKSDGTTILGGDDKAGLAAIVEALQVLVESDIEHGDVEAILTIAEEGGLKGSRNLDYDLVQSKMGFVLDSGGKTGEVIIQGPAQDKINVKIIGLAAHAGGAPEEGISAIQVASEAISQMKLLRIDSETTANIGVISGGHATNIVCPEVIIEAEARSLSNEKLQAQSAHMAKCFEDAAKKYGAKANVEIVRAYDAFKIENDEPIIDVVKKAMKSLGAEVSLKTSGGGSDTSNYCGKGLKAVNLGVGMRKVHTLDEYIEIEDLMKSAALVVELVKSI